MTMILFGLASRFAMRDTCNPNSRVGTTINACTADRVGSIPAKQGSRNANVLPLPFYVLELRAFHGMRKRNNR